MMSDQSRIVDTPSPFATAIEAFSNPSIVKFGATGESLIERLFRKASVLIMEHNGVVSFVNTPVEYEETTFVYHAAEVVDDPKLSYLSEADVIKLDDGEDYAVIARLKISSGAPTFYVGATSESFVTMAIMKYT